MYPNPEDFIKTPPHVPPRKNEGGKDQREVPKLVEITNNEVPVSHNTCCYVLLVYISVILVSLLLWACFVYDCIGLIVYFGYSDICIHVHVGV